MKHQSKPQVYKSDIQENNVYLLQSENRKAGEATDIYKGFIFPEIYYLQHAHSCYIYQIYNDVTLVPMALVLSNYKSDIALVGML